MEATGFTFRTLDIIMLNAVVSSLLALVSSQLATVVSGVGWTHKGGDEDDPWLSLYS